MIVYHGSDTVINKPDILHSKSRLDFGKGFYVTTVEEQAERWAKRKSAFQGKTIGIAIVMNYIYPKSIKSWISGKI